MKYNINQYARALYQVLEEAEKNDTETYIQNLNHILLKNNDLNLMDKIIEKFDEIDKKKKGILKIKISSAKKLDNHEIERLKRLMNSKVEIKENIDRDLIGGLKIEIGDLLIDGSIKTKINQLKQNLIK